MQPKQKVHTHVHRMQQLYNVLTKLRADSKATVRETHFKIEAVGGGVGREQHIIVIPHKLNKYHVAGYFRR